MNFTDRLDEFTEEVKTGITNTINNLVISDEEGIGFEDVIEIQEGTLVGVCIDKGTISAMYYNADEVEMQFIDFEFLSVEELVFIADTLLSNEFKIKNIIDIG
jgi:hypothetical protein